MMIVIQIRLLIFWFFDASWLSNLLIVKIDWYVINRQLDSWVNNLLKTQ
jgi:hypothetical protein